MKISFREGQSYFNFFICHNFIGLTGFYLYLGGKRFSKFWGAK